MNNNTNLHESILSAARLLEKKGDIIFSKFNITVKTYEILKLVSAGVNNTTLLAEKMDLRLAGITQKTKVLEKNGMITRKPDSEDLRVWKFDLTAKGRRSLEKITPFYEKVLESFYSSFSKSEKETALSILTEIVKHLQLVKNHQILEAIKNLYDK